MQPRDRPERSEGLPSVGRARRFAAKGGEVWELDAADAGVARRLVDLGAEGVGGFVAWGEDEEGVWALRRIPSRTLDALGKGEALEGLTALAKVRDLARALAACEKRALFAGPIRPSEVALGAEGHAEAWLSADGLVRAMVGDHGAAGGSTGPSPRWTPPEQARGEAWNGAANRYVLGLVAYRLIAGEHPYAGLGLRDAMREQDAPAPPFKTEVARALRPGVQALVLSMLAPRLEDRPASARAIEERCNELLRGEGRAVSPVGTARASRSRAEPERDAKRARTSARATQADDPPRAVPATPRGAPAAETAPSIRRRVIAVAPLAAGALALLGALLASGAPPPAPKPAPRVRAEQKPLADARSESCAPCHARQVAEWRRSVMAHSVRSPLFGALESLVEEQVGREDRCPNGAGVLRRVGADACRDERTGVTVTGTGGEHWCVNCHSAGDNLASRVPPWSAEGVESRAPGAAGASRKPLRDLLSDGAMEGISCAVCHQSVGPVHAFGARAGGYQGNPTWVSPVTGAVFRARPEDGQGRPGIANSGYLLDASSFLTSTLTSGAAGDPLVHKRAPADARAYIRTSEFCGACHDVRLFGTDVVGAAQRGEHFKRLRNAYSEWREWAEGETRAGRAAASCQGCHMSTYPGICVQDASAPSGTGGCPSGTRFEPRAPGERPRGSAATSSQAGGAIASHFFTSVDVPLSADYPDAFVTDTTLDASGLPLGLGPRREMLLRHTFEFGVGRPSRLGARLEIPLEIQNVGAGHRVPAGFSQEREIWVELEVKDASGRTIYEVGKVASAEADLRDKVFVRVTTSDEQRDAKGRPLGMFGADVVDGPDVPRWTPDPALGGTTFRGRGLVNLQNGFLRCVRCIGVVDGEGRCQPGPGQGRTRADRFADGAYDIDTGECRSNLAGSRALFETYFPVGALDAERGLTKAPDAIIDTRSAPPGARISYTYLLDTLGGRPPFRARARLRFRPFPPFLVKAFIQYEARQAALGRRPSGPQVTSSMLRRLEIVDLADVSVEIP
ncbi:MAG: hypothetical protein R3B36_06095 [Polyangiaceae bacterium]